MAFKLEEIQKNYPFLSVIKIANEEKVGIIQNCDQRIISIYCYDLIRPDLQPVFLEYGGDWWWESNRKLPVNMFIGSKFHVFSPSLRSFSVKERERAKTHWKMDRQIICFVRRKEYNRKMFVGSTRNLDSTNR